MALTTAPGRTTAPDAPALVHGQDTLPRLFRHVVRQRGDRVAMREKHLGIWRGISWREYGERAKQVGLGLVALGLRPRDVVAIVADNMPEWLYTDLGIMSVGGVPNGIYTTDSAGRSSTSSTTAARASCSRRTRSSSTRSWRCAPAARRW